MPHRNSQFPNQVDTLYRVLSDGAWHSTRDLVKRVGHTFGVSKFRLVHEFEHVIERRRHSTRRKEFEYRLVEKAAPRATARRRSAVGCSL